MTKDLSIFGDVKAELPAHLAEQQTALGNENISGNDLAIPQIKVLQPLSAEVGEVDGADPGKLLNTVTQEAVSNMFAINLDFRMGATIFKKRELGGGFHGNYPDLESANRAASDLPGDVSDYEITENAEHLLLLLDGDGVPVSPAVIYLSKSGMNASRQWNSQILTKSQGKDRFSRVWNLSTTKKSNTKGSWYVLDVHDCGWAPENLYNRAKEEYLKLRNRSEDETEAAA